MRLDLHLFHSKAPNYRPQVNGIHYENGFKVATNCQILVAIPSKYDPSLEGKTIDRKGNEVVSNKRFPQWMSAIPDTREHERHRVDTSKYREVLKYDFVKIGETYFRAKLASKALRFMEYLKTNEIMIHPYRAAVVAWNGATGLLMPVVRLHPSDDSRTIEL